MENAQNYTNGEHEANYFVLFPTKFLQDMAPRQAILMGVLIGMAKREGYAYPTNEYLADLLQVTRDTIQRDLAFLESRSYVSREIIYRNKAVYMRKIYPLVAVDTPPHRTAEATPTAEVTVAPPQGSNHIKKNITISNSIDNKRAQLDALFEKVWEVYGKVGNKKTAHAKFVKLPNKDLQEILHHLPRYVENHRESGKLQFLPHLTTYLNQARYRDDMPYKKANSIENLMNINWDSN